MTDFDVSLKARNVDKRFGELVSNAHWLDRTSWDVLKASISVFRSGLLRGFCGRLWSDNAVLWHICTWEFDFGLLFLGFVG